MLSYLVMSVKWSCVLITGVASWSQDMTTLRDYIAFARTHIHPGLSEEAAQLLVQAYVGQ